MPDQPEQPKVSGILRVSSAQLQKMFESGDAKLPPIPYKDIPKEFNTHPHTPEFYTRIMESVWKERGYPTIPFCPYSQEDIKKLEQEGRRLGFLPKEISTQKNRCMMGVIWPGLKNSGVDNRENNITNEEDRYGWFDYESSIRQVHNGTTEDQLKEIARKEKRFGMNVNEYVVASQDSKIFTDKYLDQDRSVTRLLGSRVGDTVVTSDFHSDGRIYFFIDTMSYSAAERLGGRLIGLPGKI